MSEQHSCDKALIIAQQGEQLRDLGAKVDINTGRITEMETTLFGAKRDGTGGFIKETLETMEIVRKAVMRDAPKPVSKRRDTRAIVVAFFKSVAGPAIVAAIMLLK